MQLIHQRHIRRLSCDTLPRIETEYDTRSADTESGDTKLAVLLRRAGVLRKSNPVELQVVIHEIIALESYTVKQMVAAAGYKRDGRSWVSEDDIQDVTSLALMRVAKFLYVMQGTSIGEFRAAVKKCVQWAVADHVRGDQRVQSVPVDPGSFTGALSPEEQQYGELVGLAANNRAEDRAEFKERLETIKLLEPRAADVISLRLIEGRRSKEVAEILGITPANVDQILLRSVKKLRELAS